MNLIFTKRIKNMSTSLLINALNNVVKVIKQNRFNTGFVYKLKQNSHLPKKFVLLASIKTQ